MTMLVGPGTAGAPPQRRARLRRRVARAAAAIVLTLLAFEVLTWPDVAAAGRARPATTAAIERARADGADIAWTWVPLEEIAPAAMLAVLVAEDARFLEHGGFDEVEMRAAIGDAVRDRALPRGASTITQQLARTLWLDQGRNPLRKVKEALLTIQLERTLSKRRILELYVNVAPFGRGTFGIEAAARRAFGKPAAALDDDEAARLAALLPAPEVWSISSAAPRYLAHVGRIAARMRGATALRDGIDALIART